MIRAWVSLGAVFALLSVACGAFGAHGLEGKIEPRMLAVWETGARYQMYHALGLILLGLWLALWASRHPGAALPAAGAVAGWAFTVGIVLFSGSLYALVLSGVRMLGAVTPFGGISLMIGWAAFALLTWKA